MREAAGAGEVVATEAVFGGGTQPGAGLPSAGVALRGDVSAALRAWEPPIVARVAAGATTCDLRTVDLADDPVVAAALAAAARG